MTKFHEEYVYLLILLTMYIGKENPNFNTLCKELDKRRSIYSPADVGNRKFVPYAGPKEMRPDDPARWADITSAIWKLGQAALAAEPKVPITVTL